LIFAFEDNMTTITATTATATTSQTQIKTASSGLSSDFETFLKMLTTQLKNQDPMNPVDSADYAVQLATFSSVEQQVLTNDLLRDLATQMGASGMAQLSGWVGMEGLSPAARRFDGATPISLDVAPEPTADRAELVVRDGAGREVQRYEIGADAAQIQWSGRNAYGYPSMPGLYSFSVESFLGETSLAETPVQSYSLLTEARVEGGEVILVTDGGAEIAANAVTGIRKPS
jgi:flagellar basal-body rod modification protein FlgD